MSFDEEIKKVVGKPLGPPNSSPLIVLDLESTEEKIEELKTRAREKNLCLRCLMDRDEEVPITGNSCSYCGAVYSFPKPISE